MDCRVAKAHRQECLCHWRLVHAWGSLPVDDADELPRAADQVHLQLPVLIQNELGGGIENACAFGFVLIVQIDFAGGEIVGFRAGVPVNFAEAEKTIGDEANLAAVLCCSLRSDFFPRRPVS